MPARLARNVAHLLENDVLSQKILFVDRVNLMVSIWPLRLKSKPSLHWTRNELMSLPRLKKRYYSDALTIHRLPDSSLFRLSAICWREQSKE